MANVSHRGTGFSDVSGGTVDVDTIPFLQAGTGAVTRGMQDKVRETVSVTDFGDPATTTNWRTAIVNAMAYLTSIGGGSLWFPAGTYEVNNTGVGPISWTASNILWQGASPDATLIKPTATDGTAFISFNGGVQRCGFYSLGIQSQANAGNIWETTEGISFSIWHNLHVYQKNPAKSIMIGTFSGTGGMFENRFVHGVYEHGTPFFPATVSAFDFTVTANLFTLNKWLGPIRFHCHGGQAYFFTIRNNAVSAFIYQNEWTGVNVEVMRRGFLDIAGGFGYLIQDVMYYDSTTIDGHMIKLRQSDSGQQCEQITLSNIRRISGDAVGVAGTSISLDNLTQTAGTATATTATNHSFGVGERVYVAGASPNGYNGRVTVLSKTSNTFTYAVDSSLSSPANGTKTVELAAMDVRIDDVGAVNTMFFHMGGTGSTVNEIDLNNRSAIVLGDNSRVTYYRESETLSTVVRYGNESNVAVQKVNVDTIEARTAGSTITSNSLIAANLGINIGAGDNITLCKVFSGTLDFPSVAANGGTQTLTVSATGVGASDRVCFNPQTDPGAGLVWNVWLTSNTINVRVTNVTAGAIDPPSGIWRFTVFSHN